MSLITNGKVSVGCPPPSSLLDLGQQWTSFQFHFHNFADLVTFKNYYIASPEFTCNGHQWQLRVYPGGDCRATEGDVSVFLQHLSDGSFTTTFEVKIMDKFGKKSISHCCKTKFSSSNKLWGWVNFIPRSDIVDESKNVLDSNGTLTVVISVTEEESSVFVPRNPFPKTLKEMFKFNDPSTADVCFKVVCSVDEKGGDEKENDKKSKASVTFHAHRLFLRNGAPMLADLLGTDGTADITDIEPDIFHHLLYYVYGGEVPEEDLKTHAKDVIDAADKYAIVNLKLAAEAAYVESTDITFDNAIDDLLYADAKNCALLKEKIMHFLADNHLEAAEKISFTDCPGHVMKDLLIAFGRNSKKDSTDTNADKLTTLSVSELRRILNHAGLEVDGSREAMIDTIKAVLVILEGDSKLMATHQGTR